MGERSNVLRVQDMISRELARSQTVTASRDELVRQAQKVYERAERATAVLHHVRTSVAPCDKGR